MIFGNPQKTNYAYLLRDLLIKPDVCPDRDKLPKSKNEWSEFIDLAHLNKLITIFYHFLSCKKCSSLTPRTIQNTIHQSYTETLIREENYRKIKKKIKKFIKDTGTSLILLKDLDKKYMRYYPPYYIPLKFDIDIFGRYKDLTKFRKFIAQIGYDPKGYHYGWPDKPISQYKFTQRDKKSLFPQVEYRYKAFTVYPTKKNILDMEHIEKFTQELWQNIHLQRGDFAMPPPEYLFVYHALIAYLEDNCRGINNLYRIWLLSNKENNINWKKVEDISIKYKVLNIINFNKMLTKREFSLTRTDVIKSSISTKLALRIINIDYICRARVPSNKYFTILNDGYVHFLTRGLLIKEPFWRKIIFYLHPTRLLFLLWKIL